MNIKPLSLVLEKPLLIPLRDFESWVFELTGPWVFLITCEHICVFLCGMRGCGCEGAVSVRGRGEGGGERRKGGTCGSWMCWVLDICGGFFVMGKGRGERVKRRERG